MQIIVLIVMALLVPGRAEAHGTEGWLEDGKGMQLVARYDDGEPMRFAEVTVTCSELENGSTTVFQTGNTDRNGIFIFVPDVVGRYRVTVRDEMGHQLVLGKTVQQVQETSVSKLTLSEDRAQSTALSKPIGASAGVAAIFGFCGMVYGWRQKRLCRKMVTGKS